ncbi:MAG: efflux transporter outer membrane subunit [Candidatus Latescibacterota bacterium]|nr:efflux transporter outer membrane subunit [Candidatus Latescibacterota bacterium]
MFPRRCNWIVLLTLASCVTTPPIKHPQSDVNLTKPKTELVNSIPKWWEAFEDTSLNKVVEKVLEANHDLRIAAARLEQAKAQALLAKAPLLPTLGTSGTASRRKQSFLGFPIRGNEDGSPPNTTTNSYGVNINANWEVDIWGKLRNNARAALADAQAVEADYFGARLSLTAQATNVYLSIIEARNQVKLATATLTSYQIAGERISERYNRGLSPSLDLRLARSNSAAAVANLSRNQQVLDQVERQLILLLGQYTKKPKITISINLPTQISPTPPNLPANLISRRPDLSAAERRLTAAENRRKHAELERLPRFSLTASNGSQSSDFTKLLNGNFSVWNLVGNLTQPLLQGGRIRANLDQAYAGIDLAHATYAKTALRAYVEIDQAINDELRFTEQARALSIASAEAYAAQSLAEDRYAKGLSNLTTLLDAQRRAYDAESRLLSVKRQRLNARINLIVALGGDFSQETSQSDPMEYTE